MTDYEEKIHQCIDENLEQISYTLERTRLVNAYIELADNLERLAETDDKAIIEQSRRTLGILKESIEAEKTVYADTVRKLSALSKHTEIESSLSREALASVKQRQMQASTMREIIESRQSADLEIFPMETRG